MKISNEKLEALHQILLSCANDEDVLIADTKKAILGLLGFDTGKTLRDEFAMAALSGLLSTATGKIGTSDIRAATALSYQLADAMTEARK